MAVSFQGDIWGTGVDLPIGLIHEYNRERSDDIEPMKDRRVLEAGRSMVELTANGWNWHPMDEASFRAEANQLMVAVSRETLGVSAEDALRFEFKWADNYHVDDDVYAFTTHGDSAPPGRFNYLYRTE